jgi:epoxyqueuosine reductase
MPYACRAVAREGIVARHRRGEFDEAFYQEWLASWEKPAEAEVPSPRSLIAVAVPDRPVRLRFTLDGESITTAIPPTYLHWERKDRTVEERLARALAPSGFAVIRARGPTKAMAALSTLARYGRNNLTYVDGLGSYHRPVVLVSDLPCDEVSRLEPEALPRCATCRACLTACPTGAIGSDRFLLHAERCLTYWNEKPPDVPFPDWVRPEWHTALVGCMRCQEVCPENGPFAGSSIEGPSFDEEATRTLLSGTREAELTPELRRTLAEWDLLAMLEVFPRNLGALFTKGRRRTAAHGRASEEGS